MDVITIDEKLLDRIRRLGLPAVKEKNPYVVLSIRGDGERAPEKWNAKVYRNKEGRLRLVTVDLRTLQDMLEGRAHVKKRIIQVDDAGWGFPIGGVMIGATDGARVETAMVPVEYFQGERFRQKDYLKQAAEATLSLLERFGARPEDTAVEICTGYVNVGSKEALRKAGYDVRVAEIAGLLQEELERRFAEYVRGLGYPGYLDPKATHDSKEAFEDIMKWIMEAPEERMRLAKTGWRRFKLKRGA